MSAPILPLTISGEKVREALESLGINTDWLQEVHYTRCLLTVVHARTDDRNRPTVAGEQLSTLTTTIGVEGPVGNMGGPR